MHEDDISVKVAVRIRPQTPREIIDMCQICTTVTPGEPQVTLGNDRSFTYNYVFDTHVEQETIYETCVASLIESSFEGYNATVLAYGQTGSGKTYTMGSGFDVELQSETIGIIPRAFHHLFDGIKSRRDRTQKSGVIAPKFKVTAQFMELYNEEIIDLFDPCYNKEETYKIQEDPYGGIQVKGVTLRPITSVDEALQCLRLGALSRTTASTQMNTQSSRSHAIFTLIIRQQKIVPSVEGDSSEFETLTSKFHFVDLAGSERLKRTGATGERQKEGISINCGLLALGNVISALGDMSKKALHIPYRDSKLTRLLQDSLGGNSQTLMIACVSPSDRDFMETLNTLKYANRARNIKNKISVNQDKTLKTISQLKQHIAQLQLELVEYKQGKRIVSQDGIEMVNDMFYENNMLQSEANNLRIRVKAMQQTIDSLTLKITNLLSEKATGSLINSSDHNDVASMIQIYLKEIAELQTKLLESTSTCEILRKQLSSMQSAKHTSNILFKGESNLLEDAKRELQKEKEILERGRRSEMENFSEDSDNFDSDTEKNISSELKDELVLLINDIDMKQKLVDELELSKRRMHTMRQHYEEKLIQLQQRIKNTQEERDKILHSYNVDSEPSDKVKKIKEEYTRKLSEMQKELIRLKSAEKEHARLIRNQNQHENQLKVYKNEILEMKQTKVRLINKMKEESQKHKEAELRKIREIAQLRKESRKNANTIKTMEAERKIKDQVLKRKQEEVLVLRKNQKTRLSFKASGLVSGKTFSEKGCKQKWLKLENFLNNIALSRRGLVEQGVRMEHFLQKREALGKELEVLEARRKQVIAKNQDTTQLDSYIEDVKENINYVQETISETQHNVMELEESEDPIENRDLQHIVKTVIDINEAKYIIQKLFNMTLSQSQVVAQRNAKLKENEATLLELQQESNVKGQLLDHVLHNEIPIFSKKFTKMTNNANDMGSSNESTRSSSPFDAYFTPEPRTFVKTKVRRRTAQPAELLFGLNTQLSMTQSQDSSSLRFNHSLQRVPSMPGNLKLNS